MRPPLYSICKNDSGVTALLDDPPRVYPFSDAPQDVTTPYVVWQLSTGFPENNLNKPPDVDSYTVQIDVYGDMAADVTEVAKALRDAIEPHGYVASYNGEGRETDTRLYRYSFDADFFVTR